MSIVVRKPRAPLIGETGFAADVLVGLAAVPKRVPPKYFYDHRGSELFERITELPEYYPTRTEIGILQAHAGDIAKLIPPGAAVIEFGAGSAAKTRLLLEAARQIDAYVPVDISGEFLADMTAKLRRDRPDLRILPIEADFTQSFALPTEIGSRPLVGFFPGSTIGNFEPHEANALIRHAAVMLGPGALFVIGFDLVKATDILNAAYNDAAGVTAAFNLNLLTRINRELGGDFDLNQFRHRAFYDEGKHRIEMHLVSLTRQRMRVCGKAFDFRRGETIHTENSYKYTVDSFLSHARGAGWAAVSTFTDERGYFAVVALRAARSAAPSRVPVGV